MTEELKQKIRNMSIDDIIAEVMCLEQGQTFFAICENDDDQYNLEMFFDKTELSEIICTGAFNKFTEADFIESSYMCVYAAAGYKHISEAEVKLCKTEDEVKDYVISLIEEDAVEGLFEEDREDEEDDE